MKKIRFILFLSFFLVVGCGDGSGPKFSDSEAISDNENETTDDLSSDEVSDEIQNDNGTSDQNEVKDEEVDEESTDPDKNDETVDVDEVPDDGPECIVSELKCEGTVLYSCDNGSWIVEKDCLDEDKLCRNEACFAPGVDDPRLDFVGPHYGGDTILILNTSADGYTESFSGTLSAGVVASPEVKNNKKLPFQINDLRPPMPDLGRPLWLTDTSKRLEPKIFSVGDTDSFNIYNFSTGGREVVNAELKYSGTKVEIWLVSDVTFSDENIQAVAQEFETNIYNLVTTNFYDPPDVDGNGKVSILLGNLGGPGGYITSGDFYTKDQNQYSNFRDLLYIETARGVDKINNVIAHEFQHLCHANRNLLVEGDWDSNNMSYTWIDEGLAMASMYFFQGKQQVETYVLNSPAYTSIRDGNSFIFWDTTDSDKVQSDYAMTYLFFQYLRIQSGNDATIYKDIIECTANDYTCVEDVIKEKVDPDMDFGEFLTNFRIALVLNDATGPYGFGGDDDFEFTMQYFTGPYTALRGGGGLYIESESLFVKPSDAGKNTIFVGIMTGDGEMPDDGDIDDSDIGADTDTETPDADLQPDLTSIYDIKQTVADETEVVFTGIVAAVDSKSFFVQTDPDEYDAVLNEKYSAVFVYINDGTTTSFGIPVSGDVVEVYGTKITYNGLVEISDITDVKVTGSKTIPAPVSVTPADVQSFEYDGVLVDVGNVTVTSEFDEYNSFVVTDSLIVAPDIFQLSPAPQIGEVYSVKGVMKYFYNFHRIYPRSSSDVVKQ